MLSGAFELLHQFLSSRFESRGFYLFIGGGAVYHVILFMTRYINLMKNVTEIEQGSCSATSRSIIYPMAFYLRLLSYLLIPALLKLL